MHDLEEKLRDKSAKIGIVGLGYVGLPLAVAFSEAGFEVLGFDMQQRRVDLVNQGQSYITDIDNSRLSIVVGKGLLETTTKQSKLSEVNVVCICVPTPLTKAKEPDLSHVTHESEQISRYLQPGQLVVLESTTYPGTTREVILPILERSGLRGGAEFYLAYSPERVDPGNKKYGLRNVPKIVGGMDSRSTELAQLLYCQIAEVVIPVSCPEVAELTKVFENVFRSVNIALVNELAQLCQNMGISVWEVIDVASTKPFGYMPFYPGPGVGGHCIPLDPYYLASKAREYDFHTRFIELAAEINERMPYYVVSCIMKALNTRGKSLDGAKVLVLGVTYKKDIGDIRESPSLKLVQLLQEEGAKISYNDPFIARIQFDHYSLASVKVTEKSLSAADCVVLATDHCSYDLEKIVTHAKLVFDARGTTKKLKHKNIIRLGDNEKWERISLSSAGYWGKNLVRNFAQLGALHTICDTDPQELENLKVLYPWVNVATDYSQAFKNEEIKGVVIATPAMSHYSVAKGALLAGKDTFVEKPLALDVEEGSELVKLAEEKGRILMVGHLLEYHPTVVKLKELIDNGELGKVQYIYSNRLNLGQFRTDENILWSFAPHDISVIVLLLGGEMPQEVSAHGGYYLRQDIADVTVSTMEFKNGVRAFMFLSWLHPYKERKLVVIGDRKMAEFNDASAKEKLLLFSHEIKWMHGRPVPQPKEAEVIEVPLEEPLRIECQDFLECIQNRKKPRADGHKGLQVLEILSSCQRSLEEKGKIMTLIKG